MLVQENVDDISKIKLKSSGAELDCSSILKNKLFKDGELLGSEVIGFVCNNGRIFDYYEVEAVFFEDAEKEQYWIHPSEYNDDELPENKEDFLADIVLFEHESGEFVYFKTHNELLDFIQEYYEIDQDDYEIPKAGETGSFYLEDNHARGLYIEIKPLQLAKNLNNDSFSQRNLNSEDNKTNLRRKQ